MLSLLPIVFASVLPPSIVFRVGTCEVVGVNASMMCREARDAMAPFPHWRLRRLFRWAGKFDSELVEYRLHQWYRADASVSQQNASEAGHVMRHLQADTQVNASEAGHVLRHLQADTQVNASEAELVLRHLQADTRVTRAERDVELEVYEPMRRGTKRMHKDQLRYMDEIHLREAHDFVKDRKAVFEDVIVHVADSSYYEAHRDLPRHYRNEDDCEYNSNGEYAPNGVDDDENGFPDDCSGWNFIEERDFGTHGEHGKWDMIVGSDHGTHVASVISAKDNKRNIVGVCPNCKILVTQITIPYVRACCIDPSSCTPRQIAIDSQLRCGDDPASCCTSRIMNWKEIESLVYADRRGAQVSVNSWGGARKTEGWDEDVKAFLSKKSPGKLIVAATGNDQRHDHTKIYPAQFKKVFAVGSTGVRVKTQGVKVSVCTDENTDEACKYNYAIESYFSSFKTNPDIYAPGYDIAVLHSEPSGSRAVWGGVVDDYLISELQQGNIGLYGGNIPTPINSLTSSINMKDSVSIVDGTSFSTPIVGGIAGLMIGMRKDISTKTIKKCLKRDATAVYSIRSIPVNEFATDTNEGSYKKLVKLKRKMVSAYCALKCAVDEECDLDDASRRVVHILKDPHLFLPHGRSADFRGTDGGLFAFVSSTQWALNVRTQFADFRFRDGALLVHGSYITEVHAVAPRFTLSFRAADVNELNFGWSMVTGTCGAARWTLGPYNSTACDGVVAETSYSTLHLRTADWLANVTAQPIYDHVAGPSHRLDVRLEVRHDLVKAHGIVGQTFFRPPRDGNRDIYPLHGEYTTEAMAEGILDGTWHDYALPTPHATKFRYSLYDA